MFIINIIYHKLMIKLNLINLKYKNIIKLNIIMDNVQMLIIKLIIKRINKINHTMIKNIKTVSINIINNRTINYNYIMPIHIIVTIKLNCGHCQIQLKTQIKIKWAENLGGNFLAASETKENHITNNDE